MSVTGGLEGDPGVGDVLAIRAAALRWREQGRRLLDRQDDLVLAGGSLATMRGQAIEVVAEEALTVQGLVGPLVQVHVDGAELLDTHADAVEEFARRAGVLMAAEADARVEAVYAHGRAVDEAGWCNPPAVLPAQWWQRPWTYPLDPPASFYSWLTAIDTLEQVHVDWAALCVEREDWDRDVAVRLGAVADPPVVGALGGGWGSELAQAGRRAADLAQGLEAGEAAAALSDRILSGMLSEDERVSAIAQLEGLLADQGQDEGFAEAYFARTDLEETTAMFAMISPVGVTAAGSALRLAFGTWAHGLTRTEQEDLGRAMWAQQDGIKVPAFTAPLVALFGSTTLPVRVVLSAASEYEKSVEYPVSAGDVPRVEDHVAAALLGAIARHPHEAREFLAPVEVDRAEARIALWASVRGGDLEFATAYAEAVASAGSPDEIEHATRLVSTATEILARIEFTGSDATAVQITRAYQRDFLSIGSNLDDGTDIRSLESHNLASVDPRDMTKIISQTSLTQTSREAWTLLAAEQIITHGDASTGWDDESRRDVSEHLMRSSGIIVGAIEERSISQGASRDEAHSYAATAVGVGVSLATLGLGNAAALAASSAGAALGVGSGVFDYEGAAVAQADREMQTSFELFTTHLTNSFGEPRLVTPNRLKTLEDIFYRHGREGAGV